ncbi:MULTISPECIES: helix-turn-helix domain-containing protein [Ramlibacter]|uniref:Helix-turn-helix domain-containing protein n=1 Tax=Ramlibacter pinisoli TaxID=2682844 RepID=A0A6N8IYW5_9BURK|nr:MULTISPECIES: helix-turn-helix domain-containing protein [Ramlibacter]MBA2962287.1 helix-turn-helix domain-containing protein [Ramlibacter sp. CGMCC 1.13660]MVQ32229.1 helix-turn-helix domain-containing protein [Ramlibacter pinisoli]
MPITAIPVGSLTSPLSPWPQPAAPEVRIPFRARGEAGEARPPPRPREQDLSDEALRPGLPARSSGLLDGAAFVLRRIKIGQPAYLEGDALQSLFAVLRGSFKASVLLRDGRDQVTGFWMAGDLMGMDGIAGGAHALTATALEDSDVWVLPFTGMQAMSAQGPQWQEAMCRALAQEVVREYRHMQVLGGTNTETRLAYFLLEMSDAMQARGYSATEFHLRMSRAEIGSYLGVALETVSRTLSAFQQLGIIGVHKRHITIHSLDALRAVRDGEGLRALPD